jgi:hypothetical protein
MKAVPVVPEQQGESSLVRLQWRFRALIAICGLIDCWNARFQNNPDGISIMDMGDRYWGGNWHAALNSYWSPLYGLLTGLMLRVTRPGIRWEYPEVHLLNFVIFLATLVSFEFFWRELISARSEGEWVGASRRYAWAVGYLLFICVYLGSRMLEYVNPDLMVSAFVLLVFWLVLRISAGRAKAATGASLGVALGVGYLAKAAMLPFGVVVLVTLFAVMIRRRQRLLPGVWAFLVFLLISVPFIAALSWNNHHFTTGDSGKLNIAWNVNGVNGSAYEYRLWLGDAGSSAHREHPVRKILNWPEVYEFATPISGTYPVWEDPTYWWAGVDTKLHPAREAVTFVHSIGKIAIYLIKDIGVLTTVVLMIFLLSDRVRDSWRQLAGFWPILIPTVAVFMMYAIIVWLTRYTTGVMLAGFAALVASLSISQDQRRVKVLRASSIALGSVAIVLVLQSMFQNYHDVGLWARQVEVAERLDGMGIERGDHLAIMGDGFDEEVWARLNGVEIIAEVPHTLATGNSTSAFWSSTSEVEQKVLDAVKSTGARALVAQAPDGQLPPGWAKLGNSGHVVFFFR